MSPGQKPHGPPQPTEQRWGVGGGAKAGGTRALMKEKAVPTLSCLTSLSPPPAPTAPVRTRFPPRLLLRLH